MLQRTNAACRAVPHHAFLSASCHTQATNVMIIFGLTSTMSSHVKKTVAPSLRATEMTYFAFLAQSSGVSPVVTRAGLIARGSIVDSRSRR